jgi:hypothetical protein
MQPPGANVAGAGAGTPFATEPIWTQLIPLSPTRHYILFWYVAETVPPEVEEQLNASTAATATPSCPTPYQYPPRYPADLTLAERVRLEPVGYEPFHHPNTGVDAEEALYEAYLLPIDEALHRLRGHVQEDVVRQGWEAILRRHAMESGGHGSAGKRASK